MAVPVPAKKTRSWGVNLAEGCEAVNDAESMAREARDMRERRDVDRLDSYFVSPVPRGSLVPHVSCCELCSLDTFLYKNACAGH